MTRLDTPSSADEAGPVDCDGPRSVLLAAREVPLGGVRAMAVRRALPQRDLPMVGAWCFLDRFGPQRVRMRVEPHPHVGLQTVTWPLTGQIRHRDSVGSDVTVRPGELNLMTSGAGISHSEYSIGDEATELDALQFWVALPESRRHGPPSFDRYTELPRLGLGDAEATVVVGTLSGATSPAQMYTPIVGAQVHLPAGGTVTVPLRPGWEHALAGVDGGVRVAVGDDDVVLPTGDLLYLGVGREQIRIDTDEDATVFLLGGEPFEADIVMWWNFVGRSHDEIVAARRDWQAGAARFGHVVTHGDERIPAPPMPQVRLRGRRRRL